MYRLCRVKDVRVWEEYVLLEVETGGPRPEPGQFYMLRIDSLGFHLPRPFSAFSHNRGKTSFLVKIKGRFTKALSSLLPGDRIKVLGPLGNSFPRADEVVLVAGGVGVAPLSYYRELYGGKLLWGVKSIHHLVPWIKEALVASEDGSFGFKGTVVELLKREKAPKLIYACGPRPMISALVKSFPGVKIKASLEETMGCGLGLCYGCSIITKNGPKRVCREGPVFDTEELVCSK